MLKLITVGVLALFLLSCNKKKITKEMSSESTSDHNDAYLIQDDSSSEIISSISNSYFKLEITHHIDRPEASPDGSYLYYYEYDVYEFRGSKITYIVRSYSDTPKEASISNSETNTITQNDYTDELFLEVIEYLKNKGKTQISFLGSNGYEPIKMQNKSQ